MTDLQSSLKLLRNAEKVLRKKKTYGAALSLQIAQRRFEDVKRETIRSV